MSTCTFTIGAEVGSEERPVCSPESADPGPARSGNQEAPSRELWKSIINAGYCSATPILLSAISLPAMAFIIRMLGSSDYGNWATATFLVTTVGFLTNLGLRGTFIRSVAQNPASAPPELA